MPTITLKNIPQDLYDRLRYHARQHHRSLNSEIIHLLEKAVGLATEDPRELREAAAALRARLSSKKGFGAGDVSASGERP